MRALLSVIDLALVTYMWVLIASAVFSWLYAFNVINASNQAISTISNVLHQLTEPVLVRVRRFVPLVGNLDISPIVVIFLIYFIRQVLWLYIWPYVF